MRKAGYLKTRGPVRIDSTHMLADIAAMSRLECVRETLRLSLDFLIHFGGSAAWEPWISRYAERQPKELRDPSLERLKTTMATAGIDCAAVLAKAETLGPKVGEAEPVRLLRRVFGEQFESAEPAIQLPAAVAGAVQNPHDPDAEWSTKGSLGKTGWIGYKLQVCETVPEAERPKGEPTEAMISRWTCPTGARFVPEKRPAPLAPSSPSAPWIDPTITSNGRRLIVQDVP